MIVSNGEGIEDQLDRLNLALNNVLKDIKENPHHLHGTSRFSIAQSDLWTEEHSESSDSFQIDYDTKIEDLLVDQDRYRMVIEDFCSSQMNRQEKMELSLQEISDLISQLQSLTAGKTLEILLGKHLFLVSNTGENVSFTHLAHKNDKEYISKLESELQILKKSIFFNDFSSEKNEPCSLCGLNPFLLKKEAELEFYKRKNETVEKEKYNLDRELEELDKLKDNYLAKCKEISATAKTLENKKFWLEKNESELIRRKSLFEKRKTEWENKVTGEGRRFEDLYENIFSPSKFSQEELENQLKDLKELAKVSSDSKIVMKISHIESQISRLKTEKAISECNKQNSRVLYSLVTTFDKETSQDENKRKRMIDRTNKRLLTSERKKNESGERFVVKRNEDLALQILDKKYELLAQKEKDLIEKEKFLQETWKKTPAAEELVEVLQISLEHLNQKKSEIEIMSKFLDQERGNIVKVYEILINVIENIEDPHKNHQMEGLGKLKDQLFASLKLANFNTN